MNMETVKCNHNVQPEPVPRKKRTVNKNISVSASQDDEVVRKLDEALAVSI